MAIQTQDHHRVWHQTSVFACRNTFQNKWRNLCWSIVNVCDISHDQYHPSNCLPLNISMYIYLYVCMYVRAYVYTCASMSACLYVCTCASIYICTCIYVCTYLLSVSLVICTDFRPYYQSNLPYKWIIQYRMISSGSSIDLLLPFNNASLDTDMRREDKREKREKRRERRRKKI